MYVCMVITYSKGKDQPGKVANPARGRLNRINVFSLFPFAPHNLVPRDGFGRPVPHQPVHLHTQDEPGAYLRDSCRFPRRRPFVNLNRHTPSGQSRVYRVTRLRTNGVHCRESAATGPVVSNIVPNGCCHFAGHRGPNNMRSLSHTHYWYEVGMFKLQYWRYNMTVGLFPDIILYYSIIYLVYYTVDPMRPTLGNPTANLVWSFRSNAPMLPSILQYSINERFHEGAVRRGWGGKEKEWTDCV